MVPLMVKSTMYITKCLLDCWGKLLLEDSLIMAGFFSGKIVFSQLYKELTQFYQILIFSAECQIFQHILPPGCHQKSVFAPQCGNTQTKSF